MKKTPKVKLYPVHGQQFLPWQSFFLLYISLAWPLRISDDCLLKLGSGRIWIWALWFSVRSKAHNPTLVQTTSSDPFLISQHTHILSLSILRITQVKRVPCHNTKQNWLLHTLYFVAICSIMITWHHSSGTRRLLNVWETVEMQELKGFGI